MSWRNTVWRGIALLWLAGVLQGCSTLMFWKDDDEMPASQDEASSEPLAEAVQPASPEELELKLAKVWARVDELEDRSLKQAQKIRVLEKGLTLGLVPEELRRGAPPPQRKSETVSKPVMPAEPVEEQVPEGIDGNAAAQITPEEEAAYQKALASAHDLFRSGRYGRAVVAYAEVGKRYGSLINNGLHKYWIGRSWANLKEYNTARRHFVEFIQEYPQSPWMARAKLDLGRVEWRLGLQETAISRYREIIKDYPYEDAAEMAKMELQNLERTL